MLTAGALSAAPPAAAWPLIAEPRRWSSWAPHIRGAVGLGSPEVQAGRRGVVLLAFVAPVPVRITAKTAGRSWEWATGPVRITHAVEPHGDGCRVSVACDGPRVALALLRASYGPFLPVLMGNLARVAGLEGSG